MTEERRKTSRDSSSVRVQCYAEIRECVKKGLARYYREHPDLAGDERSIVAIERSMEGLRDIFAVLNTYEITKKT